jgi:signal transduction histidine kinase
VKLRVAEVLVDDDPPEAVELINGLRDDLKEAIAELRALAHGMFPPLLMTGGLADALPAGRTGCTADHRRHRGQSVSWCLVRRATHTRRGSQRTEASQTAHRIGRSVGCAP